MTKSAILVTICAILVLLSSSPMPTASATGGDDGVLGWFPVATTACQGSIAECLGGAEEEFMLDSETNRRILAGRRYISYGALSRNTVPCSRRGASYYNCRVGAQANPYSRGCSRITRCRR
ncbi:hypothetical protein NMG60_11031597 [Bertholletia excelsa]